MLSKLNPFNWSTRTVKIAFAVFCGIFVPIYFIIGLQPATAADPAEFNYDTLNIANINLTAPVKPITLNSEHRLVAPDTIAGAYSNSLNKTLIIGHSSTIFANLHTTQVGDVLTYADHTYVVTAMTYQPTEQIDMSDILAPAQRPTLIIMTCAGTPINGEYPERLIITAEALND
ncbi:class F sortase [Candidatus Saccharibacteria bacterium]|nr:class F sortase [Candidatus Saccharibacteria bacterium]